MTYSAVAVVIDVETFKMGKFRLFVGLGVWQNYLVLDRYLNICTREKIVVSLGHCGGWVSRFPFHQNW